MQLTNIPLNLIEVSGLNVRRDMKAGTEEAGIDDLSESIQQQGVLNPILVRSIPGGRYELIAGQRRLLACRMLGWASIPANVRYDLGDSEAVVISLVENVQRADLNPMDKARAFQSIYESSGEYREVARQANVSVETVRKYIRLLHLSNDLQDTVSTGDGPIGVGTLSTLAKEFKPEEQQEALDQIQGFRQDIQTRILRESRGNMEALRGLKEAAVDGAFQRQVCEDGLCPFIPAEIKSAIVSGKVNWSNLTAG